MDFLVSQCSYMYVVVVLYAQTDGKQQSINDVVGAYVTSSE